MRKSVCSLSLLLLLTLSLTGMCPAQQATEDDPQTFPIVYGSKTDGLPQKVMVRGTITRISYSPPHCGELIFAATLEVKLDGKLRGYPQRFIYLVVPCLYQPEGAEKFLNRHIEIAATKQNKDGQACLVDIKTGKINSGGVPFYCVDREELLQKIMGNVSATTTEPIEFAGTLEKGSTYRALVTRDQEQGLQLVTPLKLPLHHAARVEWLNLKEFAELGKRSATTQRTQIVFKVVEKKSVKVSGQYRWNTIYECQLITIEKSVTHFFV